MAATFGMHDANVEIDDGSGQVRRYEGESVLCRAGTITLRTNAGSLIAEGSGVVSAVRAQRGPKRWDVELASGERWTVIQAQRRCPSCN